MRALFKRPDLNAAFGAWWRSYIIAENCFIPISAEAPKLRNLCVLCRSHATRFPFESGSSDCQSYDSQSSPTSSGSGTVLARTSSILILWFIVMSGALKQSVMTDCNLRAVATILSFELEEALALP